MLAISKVGLIQYLTNICSKAGAEGYETLPSSLGTYLIDI